MNPWESAKSASDGESAPRQTNSENAETTNGKTKSAVRLKISPEKLPEAPYSKPHVIEPESLPKECRWQVLDYFRKRHEMKKAAYRRKITNFKRGDKDI